MPDIRHITIPNSCSVVVDGAKWSFVRSLIYIGDAHPSCASGAALLNYARIRAKFESANEGDTVSLDEADWKIVHGLFQAPTAGYIPGLTMALKDGTVKPLDPVPPIVFVPYVQAVSEEATKKVPEVKSVNGIDGKRLHEASAQA